VDNGSNIDVLAAQNAADQSSISIGGRVAESAKLGRFFWRLLIEAVQLGVETVAFSVEGDSLNCSYLKDGAQLKSIAIKASWFEPALKWLGERALSVGRDAVEVATGANSELSSNEFWSGIRSAQEVLEFRVRRGLGKAGKNTFKISEIKKLPLVSAVSRLAISDAAHDFFQSLISSQDGLVIVAAPDEDNIKKSLATFLSISDARYIGQITDLSNLGEVVQWAKSDLLVTTVRASDAVDALLELRPLGAKLSELPIKGVFCCGFIRAVCPNCAKHAAPDRRALESLPEGLRPNETPSYFVGRGCASCGLTGYSGSIGVESLVWIDDETRAVLGLNPDQIKLVELLYKKGTRPLLEDGVAKVLRGQATFESLYKLIKTAPTVYAKYFKVKGEQSRDDAIDVAGDFFAKATGQAGQPLRGRSAFTAGAELGEDDAPLFGSKPERKVRKQPLLAVIEDDLDQQSILEMVLKSSGYEICTATDGQKGLELIRSKMPDLIISDLMMPNMDGSELLKRLKAESALCHIPVLILTVVSDAEKEYALLDLGADDYCEKTIQRKLLIKRIENLLKRSQNR